MDVFHSSDAEFLGAGSSPTLPLLRTIGHPISEAIQLKDFTDRQTGILFISYSLQCVGEIRKILPIHKPLPPPPPQIIQRPKQPALPPYSSPQPSRHSHVIPKRNLHSQPMYILPWIPSPCLSTRTGPVYPFRRALNTSVTSVTKKS